MSISGISGKAKFPHNTWAKFGKMITVEDSPNHKVSEQSIYQGRRQPQQGNICLKKILMEQDLAVVVMKEIQGKRVKPAFRRGQQAAGANRYCLRRSVGSCMTIHDGGKF